MLNPERLMYHVSRFFSNLWSSVASCTLCQMEHTQAAHRPASNECPSSRDHEGVSVDSPLNQQYQLTREEFANGMGRQREELKSFIDEKLTHQSASLFEGFKRVNTELLQNAVAYEQSVIKVQEENADLIQRNNINAKNYQELKKAYETQQREKEYYRREYEMLRRENENLQREKENIQSELHARGGCQRQECVKAKRKVADLQRDLELQTKQLNKVSVMKQFEQQHESKHDKLGSEYEALWTNVTIILEELEKHFEDRFYAKVFLSRLFMEGYKRSKIHLNELILNTLDELFKVHIEEEWKGELENRSRIYGLLLHSSQARTGDIQRKEVTRICEELKETLPPQSARVTLKTNDLPLEKVVEVAWKFVTQPCPIIVDMPARFSKELHETNAKHWDEKKKKDSPTLIYARPVVYRSYHGILLNKALVGNM